MESGTANNRGSMLSRLNGDKVIWTIVFLLSLISIALIYSASSALAYREDTTNFAYLIKQVQFVLMGLAALFICYKIPLGWYRGLANIALLVSIGLLLATAVFGKEVNGANRWLSIGGLKFQPTEMAKIAVVLYLARALEVCRLETFKEFLTKIMVPVGITCILILVGSVSSALFVGLICLLMLIIAGVKWNYIFKAGGIVGVMAVVIIILHLCNITLFSRLDTAFSRLSKFFTKTEIAEEMTLEEKQREADKTYQADMAKVAISSVGVFGKGPGKSTQRYFLPHPYSDYIYTIIIEEYGLLGGMFVLMLYLWFLFRCIILVKNCTKIFTALVVAGLGLLITVQASLHILVNVGYLPVTGHTLPLLSLGGTSLVILSCAFGIILSVSRTIDVTSQKKLKEAAAAEAAAVAPAKTEEEEEHEIIGPDGEFK
ncbi:MAG: FtsW/RodA/SpoVE family cell cycle protein [Bacteroidales bacterium]|nr:FtsW/RodA/SpoVE family cell cycle protein [Bacteroidales bacterium]